MEDCKAREAAEATLKSSKTMVEKVLLEAGKGLSGSYVTVSTGSTVINCIDGTMSSRALMLVPVYITTGRVVAMSHVPDNLPSLPVSADIPKGQGDAPASGRTCNQCWKTVRLRTTLGKMSKGLMKRVATPQRRSYPQMMKGKRANT